MYRNVMHKLYDISLDKQATRRVFIAFILFTLVLHFLDTLLRVDTGGWGVMDMQLSFKAEKFYMILDKVHEADKFGLVLTGFAIDFIYPLVYGASLIVLIMKAITSSIDDIQDWKFKMPLVVMGLDYLENITHLYLINMYPQQIPSLAVMASWFASFKWSFAILLVLWALISSAIKTMDKEKSGLE